MPPKVVKNQGLKQTYFRVNFLFKIVIREGIKKTQKLFLKSPGKIRFLKKLTSFW